MMENEIKNNTIIVENIPMNCNEQILFEIFHIFGNITDIVLRMQPPKTVFMQSNSLQAYITFQQRESVDNAVVYSRGTTLGGNILE